ncbi:TRAP transporter substrate-binding protein [Zobellella aerophila]|uniref:TRAP transporter substrate-binding protein n=1 Tax=Zobellella aerophila TaxID=870480 RepID=A0ABP6VT88_9GAMM
MLGRKLSMLALVGTLLFVPCSAWSAEKVIRISTWGSPQHGINTLVWPTWGKWVEEATEGRVSVKVEYDLGPADSQIDLVTDGIGEVSWVFHGHKPGRFNLTQLPEIPTLTRDVNSEVASAAYWRVHEQYLSKGGEHRGVVVLATGVHGPGEIFTKEKVESLADLKNKKIRIGGGIMATLAQGMELTPVSLPPTRTYEALAQGVLDGALLTLESLKSFRIGEVAPYTLSIPGGLYRGSFTIVMNPDTLAGLSKQDQQAILAVSGERLSRLFGRMMDQADAEGVAYAESIGNTVTPASPELMSQLNTLSSGLEQDWLKLAARKPAVDGEAALTYYRQQLRELQEAM